MTGINQEIILQTAKERYCNVAKTLCMKTVTISLFSEWQLTLRYRSERFT